LICYLTSIFYSFIVYEFWKESPGPVFAEDATVLESMPKKGAEEQATAH